MNLLWNDLDHPDVIIALNRQIVVFLDDPLQISLRLGCLHIAVMRVGILIVPRQRSRLTLNIRTVGALRVRFQDIVHDVLPQQHLLNTHKQPQSVMLRHGDMLKIKMLKKGKILKIQSDSKCHAMSHHASKVIIF